MRKLFLALLATLTLSGCGYNEFQRFDEGVTAAWAEVVNNYQRRADLIPNLVATVKGAAACRDFQIGASPISSRIASRRAVVIGRT